MRKLFFFLFVYNFIFPLRLRIIPKSEWILMILPLLWVLVFHARSLSSFRSADFRLAFIFSLVLSVIAFLSSLINGGDFIAGSLFAKYSLMVLVANSIVIFGRHLSIRKLESNLLKAIVLSGVIVAITNIIEFFDNSFRMWLFAVIEVTGNSSYDISFRTHGLASSGGSSLSLGLLIIALIAYAMSSNYELRRWIRLFYGLSFVVLYCSNFVVGRTGLFLGLPIVVWLLFFSRTISIRGFIKGMVRFSLIGIAVVYIISIIDENSLNIIYKFGLEPVYNFVEKGSLESKTTNNVADMYFLPDVLHFLFGAGFWRWPTYGYSLPDPGYMKLLLSTGLFGSVLFYSYHSVVFKNAFSRLLSVLGDRKVLLYIFLLFYVAEFKEAVFVQNYSFKVMLLLLVSIWSSRLPVEAKR